MNMSQDLENNLLNSTNSSFPNLSDSTLSFLADERQHSTGTVKNDVEKENSGKDNTTILIGEDSSSGEVIVISSDSEGILWFFLLFCCLFILQTLHEADVKQNNLDMDFGIR